MLILVLLPVRLTHHRLGHPVSVHHRVLHANSVDRRRDTSAQALPVEIDCDWQNCA
jgi:hypothetical protein